MFLRAHRYTPLLPELDLFLLRERTHVMNHRRFFSHHRMYLSNQVDNFRGVSPQRRILPLVEALDTDHRPSLMVSLIEPSPFRSAAIGKSGEAVLARRPCGLQEAPATQLRLQFS